MHTHNITKSLLALALSIAPLSLTACDDGQEASEGEVREAATLETLDLGNTEIVDFQEFGDGILIGVQIGPDTPSQAITLLEDLDATPLEVFKTLNPDAAVPETLIANHAMLAEAGRAQAEPRVLPTGLRSLSVWNSTDCNKSVLGWRSYWDGIYTAAGGYETDWASDLAPDSGNYAAQCQDDPGTSYVRLGMCHGDAPTTPNFTRRFRMWADPVGSAGPVSSDVVLSYERQARYYYYGSTNYYWLVETLEQSEEDAPLYKKVGIGHVACAVKNP